MEIDPTDVYFDRQGRLVLKEKKRREMGEAPAGDRMFLKTPFKKSDDTPILGADPVGDLLTGGDLVSAGKIYGTVDIKKYSGQADYAGENYVLDSNTSDAIMNRIKEGYSVCVSVVCPQCIEAHDDNTVPKSDADTDRDAVAISQVDAWFDIGSLFDGTKIALNQETSRIIRDHEKAHQLYITITSPPSRKVFNAKTFFMDPHIEENLRCEWPPVTR